MSTAIVTKYDGPAVEYDHYDKLLCSATSNTTRRAGNVAIVHDPLEGHNIGICHIFGLIAFSRPSDNFSYIARETSHNDAAATLLAMHHFNTGDGSVAPALDGIHHRCPVRFTAEWGDTKESSFEALRRLTDVVTRRGSSSTSKAGGEQLPQPCAVLGTARSGSTGPTSMLASVYDLPQMSWNAASRDLSNAATYPLFSRVISSTDVLAEGAVRHLSDQGFKHCSVLFINNDFGSAFMRVFNQGAVAAGMKIQFVPFPSVLGKKEAEEAISDLKETGYRCIFGILTEQTQYEILMEEAYHQDIVGGDYFWFIGNNIIYFRNEWEEGSPLDIASRGVGQLEFSPGAKGQDGYDRIHEAWANLDNDALEYFNSILPSPPMTPTSFMDHYTPDGPTPFSLFAYDAVVAMGLAACNSTHDEDFFTGKQLSQAILQGTNFHGASGIVRIDETTLSRKSSSLRLVITNLRGIKDSNGTYGIEPIESQVLQPNADGTEWLDVTLDAFVYADGTTEPPPDLPPVNGGNGVNMNYIGNLRFMAYVLFGATIIASIGFGSWTFVHRKTHVVRASQPLFLGMICAGVAVMASAMIPLSVDDEHFSGQACDAACISIPWLICVGFVTIFAALFSKTWRINKILNNPNKFQRVTVGIRDVIGPLIVFMVLNVIVLTCWTIISPLRFERINKIGRDQFNRVIYSYGSCASTKSSPIPYVVLLIAINLTILVFANYQAYRARTVKTDYSETKYIAIVMVSMLQTLIIGIPVLALVAGNPQALFVLSSMILFVLSTTIMSLIFVPKVIHFREHEKAKLQKEAERRAREQRRNQIMEESLARQTRCKQSMDESEMAGLNFLITPRENREMGKLISTDDESRLQSTIE